MLKQRDVANRIVFILGLLFIELGIPTIVILFGRQYISNVVYVLYFNWELLIVYSRNWTSRRV